MMFSYFDEFSVREIAKALAKRGKTKKTGGKDGDLKEDRVSRVIYSTPPKSERIKRLRERQKEKEEQERAEEQEPKEHRLVWKTLRRDAEKREKGRPRPSAWTFEGTIEEVGNDYIDVRSWGGTLKTFIIDETTEDFWKKQAISLVDLKKGMKVRIRYKMRNLREMVAKWIKVL